MKYFMLVILSVMYMGSIAYGSNNRDCANKSKLNAFSSAGALTPSNPDSTQSGSKTR